MAKEWLLFEKLMGWLFEERSVWFDEGSVDKLPRSYYYCFSGPLSLHSLLTWVLRHTVVPSVMHPPDWLSLLHGQCTEHYSGDRYLPPMTPSLTKIVAVVPLQKQLCNYCLKM